MREALQRIVTDCRRLQSDLVELRSLTAAEQGVAVLLCGNLPNELPRTSGSTWRADAR
jgi:hypothetical protein